MRSVSRQSTIRLLTMIEDGLLDRDVLILAALNSMSEHDVDNMARWNGFFEEDETEEEE